MFLLLMPLIIGMISCGDHEIKQEKHINDSVQVLRPHPLSPEEKEFVEASFPGGRIELEKYLQKNLWSGKKSKNKIKSDEVTIGFIVTTDSTLKDFRVIERLENCDECNIEALKIASKMPKWVPAHCTDTRESYESHAAIVIKFN